MKDINELADLQDDLIGRVGAIRKVTRVPTGSADVLSTDKENDFNFTADGLYYLTDDAGTLRWRLCAGVAF